MRRDGGRVQEYRNDEARGLTDDWTFGRSPARAPSTRRRVIFPELLTIKNNTL